MVVAVSGASLTGDPGGAFRQSFSQQRQLGAQEQEAQAQQQRTQQIQRLAAIAFGVQPQQGAAQLLGQQQVQQPQQQPISPQQGQLTGQAPTLSRDDALSQLFSLSPELGGQVLDSIGAISESQREDASRRAFEIRSTPPDQRAAIIQRQATQLRQQGRDPKDTLSLLDMSSDEQDISLKTIELAALSAKERIAAQPRPVQPTTRQRDIAAEGLQPGTPEFQRALRETRLRPTTQITLPGAKEGVELAKLRAQDLRTLRAKGEKAEEELAQLDVLENIDVQTGALEPAKLALASFLEGFGVDSSGIANVVTGQAFTAESGKSVLRVLERQKGPQTDDDRRQIAKTIARLGNVSQANTFINASARAFARRTVEQRDFFDDFLFQNETLKGASRAWNIFKRNTPMVSKNVRSLEGLPMFFFNFRDIVKRDNPEASEAEIIQAWRDQEEAAK